MQHNLILLALQIYNFFIDTVSTYSFMNQLELILTPVYSFYQVQVGSHQKFYLKIAKFIIILQLWNQTMTI